MDSGKIGYFLGLVFSIVFIAVVFSTLTSVTLVKPVDYANISGTVLLNATVGSADTATNATFEWYDGNTWNFIGANTTSGNNFTYSWDTGSINYNNVVIVRVNVTNGTTSLNDISEGITVDNIIPRVENVTNTSIGQTSAVITIESNELVNSTVEYGTSASSLTSTAVNSTHSYQPKVYLTGLTENTTYYYNVTGCDYSGNCNETSTYSFTTINQIPSISNINVSVTNETAYITWTTDELANSSINYGTTTSLGTIVSNSSNVTSHAINLTGLTNGTTYYYNITSCDLIGNCNETGTYNFTTHLDDTPPVIENGSINIYDSQGAIVTSVSIDEYVNITASIGDNIAVDKAWVQLELQNGTIENRTMTNVSGSGSLTDKYLMSLYYNCTSSGVHNYTIYANDTSGNTVSSDKGNWTVYGYFTFLSNTSSTFKNFTNGKNLSILYTVINDRSTSDNYTFSFNLTNSSGSSINGTRGWLISANSTTATGIAAGSKAYFKVEVTVPLNATETFYVNARVTSDSGRSETKTLTFPQETVSVSLPSIVKVSNSTSYSGIIYTYYNYTSTSWMKSINVTYFSVSAEVSDNITNSTFSCGLYNGTSLKKSGTVILTDSNMSSDGLRLSNASCVINVTDVTAGKYNLTINVTDDKKHSGSAYKEIIVPGNITISIEDKTIAKGVSFVLSGTAYYSEDSDFKVVAGEVTASYGSSACSGSTNYAGTFSLTCPSIATTGTTTATITVKGVHNISSSKQITLTVTSSSEETEQEKLEIIPSESTVVLTENKSVDVTVFNRFDTTRSVSIKAEESGSTQHFNVVFESDSKEISPNESAVFQLNLSPFEYSKPGTYDLVVTSGDYSKTIKVQIPAFEYSENSINTNRFVEKRGNETVIGIEVYNALDVGASVNVTETIPKEVASDVDLITFSIEPVVIQEDPVVMWVLNLSAGEKKEITYTVNKDATDAQFADKPSIIISSVESQGEQSATVEEGSSSKVLYVIIIFIITGGLIVLILFKDDLFGKNQGKNLLTPGFIDQAKKKLMGDGKYHFKPKKEQVDSEKKEEEPVFKFSGFSGEEDK